MGLRIFSLFAFGLGVYVFFDAPHGLLHYMGIVMMVLGGFLTLVSLIPTNKYYCADCGQYLGTSPAVCGRCGCNRYTTDQSGVGRTVRNR